MEESAEVPASDDSGRRWIVDPLDGTTNFLHGLPHFAISIALEERGEAIAGLIYDPIKRSEEHTSELQSLMRISYAVFCLKNKNRQQPFTTQTQRIPPTPIT